MKVAREKMRQMRTQLKSARERIGRAARAYAEDAAIGWRKARARPAEWWRNRRGMAANETAIWPAAHGDAAVTAPAPHRDPAIEGGWRDRHPRLAKGLRIAGITLAAYLALPYALILVYRIVDPPISALMLRNAVLMRGLDYRWRDFEKISPNLATAAIISEDSRFCRHWGVDWTEVGAAIDQFLEEGEKPRGASTIPMQTVKNLFLWPEQNLIRKALEVPLAHFMTLIWPKQRVIEVYLNIAEWGPGIYGAEAASRYHFSVPAASLTRTQAALLVSALPNPHRRNAGRPGPQMRRLAAHVQGRVEREGADAACVFDR